MLPMGEYPRAQVRMAPSSCVLAMVMYVLSASACATFRPLPPPTSSAPHFSGLHSGDEVLLTLHDGRQVEIEIERVEGGTLVSGEGVRYTPAQIANVQVRRVSPIRTALLVGGLVAAAYATLMIFVGLIWTGAI